MIVTTPPIYICDYLLSHDKEIRMELMSRFVGLVTYSHVLMNTDVRFSNDPVFFVVGLET
jgi:hypothetical protein